MHDVRYEDSRYLLYRVASADYSCLVYVLHSNERCRSTSPKAYSNRWLIRQVCQYVLLTMNSRHHQECP